MGLEGCLDEDSCWGPGWPFMSTPDKLNIPVWVQTPGEPYGNWDWWMPSPYSWLLLLVRFGIKLSFVTGNTLRPHHSKSQVSWRSKGGKPPNWYVYLGTENPVQFPPWKRTAANPSKPAFHPHHILICIYLFHIVSYYEYYHPLNSNQNIILLQHYDTKIISSYTFSPSASNPPRGRHRPWAPGGCLRWAPATNRWIPVASLPHAAPGPGSAPKRRRCERTRTSRSRSPSPGRDRDFLDSDGLFQGITGCSWKIEPKSWNCLSTIQVSLGCNFFPILLEGISTGKGWSCSLDSKPNKSPEWDFVLGPKQKSTENPPICFIRAMISRGLRPLQLGKATEGFGNNLWIPQDPWCWYIC